MVLDSNFRCGARHKRRYVRHRSTGPQHFMELLNLPLGRPLLEILNWKVRWKRICPDSLVDLRSNVLWALKSRFKPFDCRLKPLILSSDRCVACSMCDGDGEYTYTSGSD